MTNNVRKNRRIIGMALVAVCFVLFMSLLFKIQIIDADTYASAIGDYTVTKTSHTAARGVILDCNGNALATNRQGNSVIFVYSEFPSYRDQAERNRVILSLIEMFENAGSEWIDNLPIERNASGELVFAEDEDTKISYMKSSDMLRLNDYATAQNCFDALITRYELEEYSDEDRLKLASVCFSMRYLVFSESTPYVFAEDVPTELVAMIKENTDEYPGVDVRTENYREYPYGNLAVHVLGVVGAINSDEYSSEKEKYEEALSADGITEEQSQELKARAYGLNDSYGKNGIEKYMESYLRGRNGTLLTTYTDDGATGSEYLVEPRQGSTVVSTIDVSLQDVATQALQAVLDDQKDISSLPVTGALVAIDVNTGAVKACVSLPDYDNSEYFSNYSKLSSDGAAPLWNRALQSTYAPGSTMKPAMTLAGLEEGVITATSEFYCDRDFEYFGSTFSCLASHGWLNASDALRHSCNIFFYNTASELGIERMNHYCSLLGLGQETGIELPEVDGVLAGPAYREANGGVWYGGDTVQAGIGQSDNLFTPIQLANYCATIANGGTRYVPYIIDSVYTSDMRELVYKTEPTVAVQMDVQEKNIDVIKAGMRRVITEAGCKLYFKDCVVEAAAKTGTSQVYKTSAGGTRFKANNAFFICFAPYDNPQLAIAIAGENVGGGTALAATACSVFNEYFTNESVYEQSAPFNTLEP